MIAGATHQARPCEGASVIWRCELYADPGTLRGVMYGAGWDVSDAVVLAVAPPEADVLLDAVAATVPLTERLADACAEDGRGVGVGSEVGWLVGLGPQLPAEEKRGAATFGVASYPLASVSQLHATDPPHAMSRPPSPELADIQPERPSDQ